MRNTDRKFAIVLALAVLGATLGGCAVYRPEIRQGNFLDESKIAAIKPGMTREQVQFLLGPPMVADGFHHDRWDYVYTLSSALTGHLMLTRRTIVFFDGDRVREVKTTT